VQLIEPYEIREYIGNSLTSDYFNANHEEFGKIAFPVFYYFNTLI